MLPLKLKFQNPNSLLQHLGKEKYNKTLCHIQQCIKKITAISKLKA